MSDLDPSIDHSNPSGFRRPGEPGERGHHGPMGQPPQHHRLTSPTRSGSPPACAPIPLRPATSTTTSSASTSSTEASTSSSTTTSDNTVKPRIWSLADVVASSNPHSRLSPPTTTPPHSAFGTPGGLRPPSHPHHHHSGVGPIPASPMRPWTHQGSPPYPITGPSATQTLAGLAPHPYGLAAVRAAAVSAANHMGSPVGGPTSSPLSSPPSAGPAVPSFSRLPVGFPTSMLAYHRDAGRLPNGLLPKPGISLYN